MLKKKNKGTPHESKAPKVASRSYTPISDALSQPNILADNEFSENFKRFNIALMLKQSLSKDRRSDAVKLSQIAISLLVWPMLKLQSVHCFCSELCQYLEIGGDKTEGHKPKRSSEILYDFWGREDINWRQFALKWRKVLLFALLSMIPLNQDVGKKSKERRGTMTIIVAKVCRGINSLNSGW